MLLAVASDREDPPIRRHSCREPRPRCWHGSNRVPLEQINRSLAAQYEVIKAKATYANRIKVEVKTQSRVKRCDVMQFEVEYEPPKLEFLDNNTSSVRLTTQILKGTLRQCEFPRELCRRQGERSRLRSGAESRWRDPDGDDPDSTAGRQGRAAATGQQDLQRRGGPGARDLRRQ
jgi:hypothetical protein